MQIASDNKVYILDLIKLYEDAPDVLDDCLTRILHSTRVLKLGKREHCLLEDNNNILLICLSIFLLKGSLHLLCSKKENSLILMASFQFLHYLYRTVCIH